MSGSQRRDFVAIEREDETQVRSDCWKLPVNRLVTMVLRPSEWTRVVRGCADTSVWSQSSILDRGQAFNRFASSRTTHLQQSTVQCLCLTPVRRSDINSDRGWKIAGICVSRSLLVSLSHENLSRD